MRRLLDFIGGLSAAWSNSETNNYSIGGGFIPSSPCHYCGDMGVMSVTENESTIQILNYRGVRRRFVLEGIAYFSFCRYCRLIWEVAESYLGIRSLKRKEPHLNIVGLKSGSLYPRFTSSSPLLTMLTIRRNCQTCATRDRFSARGGGPISGPPPEKNCGLKKWTL